MSANLYNRDGEAIAYLEEDGAIFSFDGDALGYLVDQQVYDYGGNFLGWFQNGWLHDRYNDPALFTRDARGGPLKPLPSLPSLKSLQSLRPLKSLRELPPLQPLRGSNWSALSGVSYFQ